MAMYRQTFNLFVLLHIGLLASNMFITAAPTIELIPSNRIILANEELHVKMIMHDNYQDLTDVYAIRFTLDATIDTFSIPTLVLPTGWLGDQTIALPTQLGALPTPIEPITLRRNELSNVAGKGELCSFMCIATIAEILRTPGECSDLLFSIKNVELITKTDFTTLAITSNDIVTPVSSSDTITVQFCPKCDINDIVFETTCSPDSSAFDIAVSFTGYDGFTYTIADDQGDFWSNVASGTYVLGPYSNGSEVVVSIRDNTGLAICSEIVTVNCTASIIAPTCDDGIQNGTETGIDCGTVACGPCQPCGLTASTSTVCTSATTYDVILEVFDDATGAFYTINDNSTPTITEMGNAGTYTFTNYHKDDIVTFNITNNADASCTFSVKDMYADCDVCEFTPDNNVCANAEQVFIGNNGPFNNYCATTDSIADPQVATCFIDLLWHTVWYSFEGTGYDYVINTARCGNLIDYENDLKIAIYDDCTSLNEVACSDDFDVAAVGYEPGLTLSTLDGVMYYIMIDGYGSYSSLGEFCLDISPICSLTCDNVHAQPHNCTSFSNGSAGVNVSGALGDVMYNWSNGGNTHVIDSLNSGDYTVTVTDEAGCSCINTVTVPDSTNNPVTLAVSEVSFLPSGPSIYYLNSIEIEISGGSSPYNLDWVTNGYVRYNYHDNNTLTIVYASDATWELTVTDDLDCKTSVINANTNDDIMTITNYVVQPTTSNDVDYGTGSINLMVTGGVQPYTYNWSNGSLGMGLNMLNNLPMGWYNVIITDSSTPPQELNGWYWIPRETRGRAKVDAPSLSFMPNTLNFAVPNTGLARISLTSINGTQNILLYQQQAEANRNYSIPINTAALSTGLYICTLQTSTGNVVHKKIFIE